MGGLPCGDGRIAIGPYTISVGADGNPPIFKSSIFTKNGATVARLIGTGVKKKSLSEQLRGIIPSDVDEKSIKAEKVSRH